jgi:hypothetical protein
LSPVAVASAVSSFWLSADAVPFGVVPDDIAPLLPKMLAKEAEIPATTVLVARALSVINFCVAAAAYVMAAWP